MKNQAYFIAGIDTGCGKTYITGSIAAILRQNNINVITQKLVQTGCISISEDILEHRRLMKCDLFAEDKNGLTCRYVFPFPASPHLSAKLEGITIDTATLAADTHQLLQHHDVVLIEGAGGLHVPLRDDQLIIDYIDSQNLPVVLIASSKLGSINHTLLSIEGCFFRQIHLIALIYNRMPGDNKIIADNSFETIKNALKHSYPDAKIIDTAQNDRDRKLLQLFFNHPK